MADNSWGGVVAVNGNNTTSSYNPRSQPSSNPNFNGSGYYEMPQYTNSPPPHQQYQNQYQHQQFSNAPPSSQYQNDNNTYALSTSVRRGNGYETVTSPRTANPNNLNASYSNALIVNEHGVGPSRRDVLALAVSDPSKMGEVLGKTTEANASYLGLIVGEGVDSTFWRPGQKGSSSADVGLLEALHLRGEDYNQDILVSSRPKEELECNFSTPDGRLFNINHDKYKFSRTKLAMRSLNVLPDDGMVGVGTVKSGLRDALPRMAENEYHLMVYRDYSDWAVKNFWKEAKKDTVLGSKYVEKCFALCVGADAGTFIPITRQQMLRGVDALVRQAAMSHDDENEGHQSSSTTTLKCFALTKQQYDALQVKRGPANEPGYEGAGHGHRHGGAGGHAYPSDYPSPWDWTPAAVQRRIGYYLEQKYKALGQFIVKSLIVVGVGYVVVGYITSGGGGRGGNNNNNNSGNGYPNDAPSRSSRYARHQARMQQNGQGYYNNSGSGGSDSNSSGPSLLSALVNPKAMFDYVLAPK